MFKVKIMYSPNKEIFNEINTLKTLSSYVDNISLYVNESKRIQDSGFLLVNRRFEQGKKIKIYRHS